MHNSKGGAKAKNWQMLFMFKISPTYEHMCFWMLGWFKPYPREGGWQFSLLEKGKEGHKLKVLKKSCQQVELEVQDKMTSLALCDLFAGCPYCAHLLGLAVHLSLQAKQWLTIYNNGTWVFTWKIVARTVSGSCKKWNKMIRPKKEGWCGEILQ